MATPTRIHCPHCSDGTLSPKPVPRASKPMFDTDGVEVRVYACDRCDYTEGRPVKA